MEGILPLTNQMELFTGLNSEEADTVDWVVILDADMIIRGQTIPWEIRAEKEKLVSMYYGKHLGILGIDHKDLHNHSELEKE
ncbi:hypothetical protein T459_02021 [Capsicum annuum]|uniref:Uncharacterized protein n=1 Tax=Capsicum annuum TaxID=4072 RepID=A0A2G3AIS1_CAPAN|nr:hypothetical protein T459_02021 [Capsicum annuum]